MDDYQVGRNYPLFEHMDQEHGLTLLEDQLWQIERIVLKMHGIEPDKCTMNPHVSRTVPEQVEHQLQEKGNQLDQVYGAMKESSNKSAVGSAKIADSIADLWPTCGRLVADSIKIEEQ